MNDKEIMLLLRELKQASIDCNAITGDIIYIRNTVLSMVSVMLSIDKRVTKLEKRINDKH